MSWRGLVSRPEAAVGEVTRVNGGTIDVFLYPDAYPRIRVGSIVAFNSENTVPLGIVLELAHEARHGSITPLRSMREDIRRLYPDIENYHMFVMTVVYTSHVSDDFVIHSRAGMPRLHDLAFIVEDPGLLEAFFVRNGNWVLEPLRYYITYGAKTIDIREFFITHREFFRTQINNLGLDGFVSEFTRVLFKARAQNAGEILEEAINIIVGGEL